MRLNIHWLIVLNFKIPPRILENKMENCLNK